VKAAPASVPLGSNQPTVRQDLTVERNKFGMLSYPETSQKPAKAMNNNMPFFWVTARLSTAWVVTATARVATPFKYEFFTHSRAKLSAAKQRMRALTLTKQHNGVMGK
jgi:hypothetical protein